MLNLNRTPTIFPDFHMQVSKPLCNGLGHFAEGGPVDGPSGQVLLQAAVRGIGQDEQEFGTLVRTFSLFGTWKREIMFIMN